MLTHSASTVHHHTIKYFLISFKSQTIYGPPVIWTYDVVGPGILYAGMAVSWSRRLWGVVGLVEQRHALGSGPGGLGRLGGVGGGGGQAGGGATGVGQLTALQLPVTYIKTKWDFSIARPDPNTFARSKVRTEIRFRLLVCKENQHKKHLRENKKLQ